MKAKVSVIKILIFCVIFILLGCSGKTTNQLEQLAKIENDISHSKGKMTKYSEVIEYSLFDLISFSQNHSVVAQTQNVQNILSQTDADSLLSSLYPKVNIQASYGRSVFLRRDEENSDFRISPFSTWDIIRVFEYNKINKIGQSTNEIVKLSTDLTNKQIMLEVIRLYNEYVLVTLEIDQLNNELSLAQKSRRTLQLDLYKKTENSTARKLIEESIRLLENKSQILQAQHSLAETKLKSFCNIENGAKIILPNFELIDFTPKPISDFLLLAISQSEGVAVSEILSEIEKQKTDMVKAKRWLNFNFTAALGDLLSNPASAIYSSLSWTYNLLDYGDYDREVIRAQASQILQIIETENQKNELIRIAGQAWINLIDRASLYEEQLHNINSAKKEIMIFEEKRSKGIFQSEKYSVATQKLFDENIKLKIFHMNYTTAIIQYASLAGESTSLWLQ